LHPTRSRHFCRSGPTCRSRQSSAPIDFRRGDPSAGRMLRSSKAGEPGMMLASTSGLRLPSAVRSRGLRPRVRSCLGLCLFQGSRARFRASDRARPLSDHQSPGPCGFRMLRIPWSPIRSWVCGVLPDPEHVSTCNRPPRAFPNLRRCCSARRRPFSVLMRLMPRLS
jgi:hypothetical protein